MCLFRKKKKYYVPKFDSDEELLRYAGLDGLPEDQKKALLEQFNTEYDKRLGERLTAALSKEKFDEFCKLSGGDQVIIERVLAEEGDYRRSELFINMAHILGVDVNDATMLPQYATQIWITHNIPDYQIIVYTEKLILADELKRNKHL